MAKAKARQAQARKSTSQAKVRSSSETKYTWTFMLYLAGDNNLSDEMVWALKEIFRVGTPEGVAVTVQFDPEEPDRSTRFYHLRPGSDAIDVDGLFPILFDDELPDRDSGDPEVVVEFVRRSMAAAPADYYMLVLSGHGGGIMGDFLTDSAAGPKPAGSLTIPAVGQIFQRLRTESRESATGERTPPIDVIGLDTCLMSMAEICSEVAGQATYLVGSEGYDPNTGWPYYRLLQALAKKGRGALPDPEGLARLLVDQYVRYYSDYTDARISVDLSVCAVGDDAVAGIEAAAKRFVESYLQYADDPRIVNAVLVAHWRSQSYKMEEYVDLTDFCQLLAAECRLLDDHPQSAAGAKALGRCCASIVGAVAAAVKTCDFSGVDFQHSHGLSVYFPWSRARYVDDYRQSRFAARTGWDRFLDAYVDGTKREMRARASEADTNRYDGGAIVTAGGQLAINEQHVTRPVRANSPSSRANSPSSRANSPSSRANSPSSRANSPSSRFGQLMDGLLNELPARTKNGPTQAHPVIAFTDADLQRMQAARRAGSKPSK